MQHNKQGETSWQYLAGFYDGEGTIGFRVVREKRLSRKTGETGGWYITPYLDIANTNFKVLEIIQKFLADSETISHIVSKSSKNKNQQQGNYLTIQSYEGIRKFLKNIYPYSLIKKEQINIINKFLIIRDDLPTLKRGTKIDNLKRNYWSKKSFLRAMKLRDKLKNTKFRKISRHKYNYNYFKRLWG